MTNDQLTFFGDTLAQARGHVQKHLNPDRPLEGVKCPCCGQLCKLYKRKLNHAMAKGLIWLVGATTPRGPFVHISTAPMIQGRPGGGDFGKLAYFDLVEDKPNDDDPSKRCSGFWRPSELGVLFVGMRAAVPAYVWAFNQVVYGAAEQRISILDALGTHFDYEELMSTFGCEVRP